MDTFLIWAKEHGIVSSHVTIQSTDHAGYGLFATKDIQYGDILVSIPQRMLVTAQRALEENEMKQVIEKLCDSDNLSFDSWISLGSNKNLLLRLWLAYSRLSNASEWKPYFDILPSLENVSTHHIQFNADLLKGTMLSENMQARQRLVSKELEILKEKLKQEWIQRVSLDTWIWASVIFWSRVVDLGSAGSKAHNDDLVLAPFFDIANHSLEPNIRWELSEQGLILTPNGKAQIKAGNELLISYGDKPNQELMFIHSFCLTENPTQTHIRIPVQPFLTEDIEKAMWIRSYSLIPALSLARHNHQQEFPKGHDLFANTGWSTHSIALMYLVALDEDDGLCKFRDSQNKNAPIIMVNNQLIESQEDIFGVVTNLMHKEVIQLRTVLLLLDAVDNHLSALGNLSGCLEYPHHLLDSVRIYRLEEEELLTEARSDLLTLQDLLTHSPVVTEYLSSMETHEFKSE